MRVYIGTQGQAIVAAQLDVATGELGDVRLTAELERPTFVLADPARPVLYAVSEVGNAGDREAAVASFAIEQDGGLRLLSRTPSGGGGATHLALSPAGTTLFVANFGGGQIASFAVAPDGVLSPVRSVQTTYGSGPHRRQTGPHAHGVTLDPSGHFVLAPDIGADRVFVYRWNPADDALTPADPPFAQLPAGCGPRYVLFGRDGRFAYLLSELSAELFTLRWADGRVEQVDRLSLDAPGCDGTRSAAALALSEDGRFLYTSNRTTHEILVYSIDQESGRLAERQRIAAGGEKPWSAEIAPGGRWLVVANQASNGVTVFAIDPATGLLTATPGALNVPNPTGIAFARG